MSGVLVCVCTGGGGAHCALLMSGCDLRTRRAGPVLRSYRVSTATLCGEQERSLPELDYYMHYA